MEKTETERYIRDGDRGLSDRDVCLQRYSSLFLFSTTLLLMKEHIIAKM